MVDRHSNRTHSVSMDSIDDWVFSLAVVDHLTFLKKCFLVTKQLEITRQVDQWCSQLTRRRNVFQCMTRERLLLEHET